MQSDPIGLQGGINTYDDDGNLTSVTDDGVQAGAMYATTYDSLGRIRNGKT